MTDRDLASELASAEQTARECMGRIAVLEDALAAIQQWCSAYPVAIFKPLNNEQIGEAALVLGEHNIDIGALHAGWARHLLDGIGKIAREALDDRP